MDEVVEEGEGEVAPSRWLTVDRLGGASTVVRRAMSAGTGLLLLLLLEVAAKLALVLLVVFAGGIVAVVRSGF